MKTSNLVSRTITCVVGIPALAAVIFLIPQYHFAGFSALIIVCALLGSLEMSNIIFGKRTVMSYVSFITVIVACFIPQYTELSLIILISIVLAFEIKSGEKDSFRDSLSVISKSILLLIYPSYYLTFSMRFIRFDNVNAYVISLFLILVFSNDMFAYIFGMLFGKKNAGVFKVSPKKSMAGFVGGNVGCIAICLAFFALFGDFLPALNVCHQIILAFVSSIMANIGDLAESVIKRCCNVKDSGSIIPGRGGILDCTDSIMAVSVLFYVVFSL